MPGADFGSDILTFEGGHPKSKGSSNGRGDTNVRGGAPQIQRKQREVVRLVLFQLQSSNKEATGGSSFITLPTAIL